MRTLLKRQIHLRPPGKQAPQQEVGTPTDWRSRGKEGQCGLFGEIKGEGEDSLGMCSQVADKQDSIRDSEGRSTEGGTWVTLERE